jgi:hypothetical protein
MLQNLWQNELTNPNADYYLPKIVTRAGFAPSYPAGDWSVGTITGDGGTQIAKNICADTAPWGQNGIPVPGTLPDLELSAISINNLDKVTMPSVPVSSGPDGLTITGAIVFTGIEIAGSFTLKQQCCMSSDLKKCDANVPVPPAQVGTGTFTLTLGGQSTATAVVVISALAPNTLTIQVDSISYVVDYTQMVATVDITNIHDPDHRQKWNAQAEKAFNYQPVQEVMVQAMNADLGGNTPKTVIGQQLTTYIDQYLQSTHQYPYDGSFAALFS